MFRNVWTTPESIQIIRRKYHTIMRRLKRVWSRIQITSYYIFKNKIFLWIIYSEEEFFHKELKTQEWTTEIKNKIYDTFMYADKNFLFGVRGYDYLLKQKQSKKKKYGTISDMKRWYPWRGIHTHRLIISSTLAPQTGLSYLTYFLS